jgi:hypothetical protein
MPSSWKQRDETYNEKSCPKAMADYLKFMGGVDIANQLYWYYEGDRRSKSSGGIAFFYAQSMINAWICFNDLVELGKLKDYTKPLSMLDFKRSIAIGHLMLGLNFQFRESKVPRFRSTGRGRVSNPSRFLRVLIATCSFAVTRRGTVSLSFTTKTT